MPYPTEIVPITGLSQLGEVLAGGARDYARQRDQQRTLADQRAYEDQVRQQQQQFTLTEADREEANRLKDEQARLAANLQANTVQDLVNQGLLDPSQANDPNAVAAAFQKSKALKTEQTYAHLLSTPDPTTGKPLLTPDQLSDPNALAAARLKFYQIASAQTAETLGDKKNAQSAADALAKQLQDINAKDDQLSQQLGKGVQQPTQAEITKLATEMASVGRKTPSNQDISANMDAAAKKIISDRMQEMMAEKPMLVQQRELLANRAQNLVVQLRELGSKGVNPNSTIYSAPPAVTGPSIGAAQPTSVTPEQAAAALTEAINAARANNPAPTVNQPGEPIVNPTNDPLIEQANIQRRVSARGPALDALQPIAGQEADLQSRIDALHQPAIGQLPWPIGGNVSPRGDSYANLDQQAKLASDLLQQKAALEAKAKALRASMYGPTVAGVTAPAISTASGSTPVTNFQPVPLTSNSPFAPPPRMTPAAALAGP